MMKIRTKSYIEKLLPEPMLNSEPMPMGIGSAPILQKCAVNVQNGSMYLNNALLEMIVGLSQSLNKRGLQTASRCFDSNREVLNS
jgi:hypothetical protein